MPLSDLWHQGINKSGPMGAVDTVWLVLNRIEIILFFVWLIIAIISLVMADRAVTKAYEHFNLKEITA